MAGPLVAWEDLDPERDPLPGEVYAGVVGRTVGDVPAGSMMVLTVLAPGAEPVAGGLYVLEEAEGDVAFVVVLAVHTAELLVERLDGDEVERRALRRDRWRVRAVIEVQPAAMH